MGRPRYSLDRGCLDLQHYTHDETACIDNIDDMFHAVQDRYAKEDVEVSVIFEGCLNPYCPMCDTDHPVCGDRVEDIDGTTSDIMTNIKKQLKQLEVRNKPLTLWHNHQFSTRFSLADIRLLIDYDCLFKLFIDTDKLNVLYIDPRGKMTINNMGKDTIMNLLRDYQSNVTGGYDFCIVYSKDRFRKAVDNDKYRDILQGFDWPLAEDEKREIHDRMAEKIREEILRDLGDSLFIGYKSFDKKLYEGVVSL